MNGEEFRKTVFTQNVHQKMVLTIATLVFELQTWNFTWTFLNMIKNCSKTRFVKFPNKKLLKGKSWFLSGVQKRSRKYRNFSKFSKRFCEKIYIGLKNYYLKFQVFRSNSLGVAITQSWALNSLYGVFGTRKKAVGRWRKILCVFFVGTSAVIFT